MKREIGKEEKVFIMIFVSVFVIIMIMSMVSAGLFESFKKIITGQATRPQVVNATVGVPVIFFVDNNTMTDVSSGPTQGPFYTSIIINFSVSNEAGAGNLNNASAKINFSLSGEDTRTNSSCLNILTDGDKLANYTCNVTIWWWDAQGQWTITAFINDTNGNGAINDTTSFTIGQTIGFEISPGILTWAGLAPGSKNQTSNNDPLLLNNTGNKNIDVGNISLNATDLRGESDGDLAIWAGNITLNVTTGGSPPTECSVANQLTHGNYLNLISANLSADNYTLNNGAQGQEQLFFCFNIVGAELTAQSYSTANESAWTLLI